MIRNTFLTVLRQDLRERMRTRRFYILLGIYLSLIGLLVSLVFIHVLRDTPFGSRGIYFRQNLGDQIFDAVIISEALLICLICPGLTSGSLSDKRERQGGNVVDDSFPSMRALTLGKLGSAIAILIILSFATLPLKSLAYSLGDVDPLWALLSFVIVFITAIFFCSIGLFFSSVTNKPITAAVSSYSAILISTLLIFGLMYTISILEYSRAKEVAFQALVSSNPFFVLLDTKIYCLDLSIARLSPTYSAYYIPTPLIGYVLVYSLLTWLLLRQTIRVLDGSSDGKKFRFWRKGSK